MDIGDVLALEAYNKSRWREGVRVGGAVDGLEKVFGVGGSVAGWGRGVGMRVLGAEGTGPLGWVGGMVRGWVMRQVD